MTRATLRRLGARLVDVIDALLAADVTEVSPVVRPLRHAADTTVSQSLQRRRSPPSSSTMQRSESVHPQAEQTFIGLPPHGRIREPPGQ